MLSFDYDIGSAIQKACDHNNDAIRLVQAAKFVRRKMFKQD